MYNVGFRFRDNLTEYAVIQRLENDGFNVRHLGGGCYSVTGLGEDWVDRIMKTASKYWFF